MSEDNKNLEQGVVRYSTLDETEVSIELYATEAFASALSRFMEIIVPAIQEAVEIIPDLMDEASRCLENMIRISAPSQVIHQIHNAKKRRTKKKNFRRAMKLLSRYIKNANVKITRGD